MGDSKVDSMTVGEVSHNPSYSVDTEALDSPNEITETEYMNTKWGNN